MITFADKVLDFHKKLQPDWKLPEGIDLLFPFDKPTTLKVMADFYQKYFSDTLERTLVFGINPGRFGAGVTGTPFTDPKILEEVCLIPNDFPKRHELSAIFVYEFIEAFGGPTYFYQHFYITSICPLGFVKNGKNYNYYDDKKLLHAVEPYIIQNIKGNLQFGCNPKVALCLGQGKNYQYFSKLNAQKSFFEKIIPLPHPRWVMQYRRKQKEAFILQFIEMLNKAIKL